MDYNERLNSFLTKLLFALGFSPRHIGFYGIRKMIIFSCEKRMKISDLYKMIEEDEESELYGSKGIQCAVRHALQMAQAQTGFKLLDKLFGASVTENPLGLYEFILIIVEYIKHFWDGGDEFTQW